MSAEAVARAALRDVLAGLAVNGVFDSPPGRARVPYAVIEPVLVADWGTKDLRGRELRLGVSVIDEGEVARVQILSGAAQEAVLALSRDLEGWRVASVVLLRTRTAEAGTGRWRATSEFRVRMMEGL